MMCSKPTIQSIPTRPDPHSPEDQKMVMVKKWPFFTHFCDFRSRHNNVVWGLNFEDMEGKSERLHPQTRMGPALLLSPGGEVEVVKKQKSVKLRFFQS